jgi:hypothetical protein
MNIALRLSSDKMDDEDLQALTRELCQQLNDGDDLTASLPTRAPSKDSKAALEIMEIGALVIGFIGSDGGKVLMGFIEKLLLREKHLELEITQPDGSKLKINAKNQSPQVIKHLISQLQ